ncbi:hypothetical protein PG989_004687 [Apiospora arundinis]
MSSSTSDQKENRKSERNGTTPSQDKTLTHVGSWAYVPSSDKPPTNGRTAVSAPPYQSSQTQQHAMPSAQAGAQGYQVSRWLQESGKEGPWAPPLR